MDFKVKLFNSEHLNEIDTRRLKIDLNNFNLSEFLLYLKSLHDIGDAEAIYVSWKNDSKWNWLDSDNDWNKLMDKRISNSKAIIKLNIYYGNVHINITCDICGNTVIGDRHKCLQCPDFDICQICFQAKPNIHKQHCFLLLRTQQDAAKFLRSIPSPFVGGVSDFRVIDVDWDGIHPVPHTDTVSRQMRSSESTIEREGNATVVDSVENTCGENMPEMGNCSSIPQDYMANLPENILQGLNMLKSMGFANMDGPLIALLIEKNGNIADVVEELEYSLKK